MANKVVEVIIRAKDLTGSVVSQFRRRFRAMERVVRTVTRSLVAATAATAAMVFGLQRLGQRGDEVNAVKRAFARITDDETAALRRLREASNGTIGDFDLMARANQALALGAAKNIEQFAEMVRVSRELGRAQGLDATTGLEKLTLGLARQSPKLLDDLGIKIRVGDATTFVARAMEQARVKADALTGGMKSSTSWAAQFATSIGNLKDALASLVADSPEVAAFFDSITDFMDDIADVLRKDSDTIVEAFKALGSMAGNAFGAAFFEAIAAAMNRIDDAILPKAFGIEDRISTWFGVAGAAAQDHAARLTEAAAAWRVVIASLAGGPDRPSGGVGGGVDLSDPGGDPMTGRVIGRPALPSAFPADAIARHREMRNRRRDPRFGPASMPSGTAPAALFALSPEAQAALDAQNASDAIDKASKEVQHAQQVTAAAMFGMAQAAVRGSEHVAQSVVSMITQIVQALPGVGGIFGTIIGGVGGLVSAAISRGSRDPVPVRMADIDDRAAEKLRNASREPIRITTIIEQGGVEIERIERELADRQNRDETVRFNRGRAVR